MDIDVTILGKYLQEQIPGFQGPLNIEKFDAGQSNPTYLLSAASGQYVLRRKPSGQLLASAHQVDREYRVIAALAGTGVPVADALHLCEDDTVIGSMFYVMSYEDGRVFWDPVVPELDNAARSALYQDMNRVLAALHDVDIAAVGLADFGRPGSYYERQVSRWTRQYRDSETAKLATMDELIDWLPRNMPPDDGQVSLVHGDYRIDNLMFEHDAPRIRAVLDWELSTLGHPFADLAYQCMQWRLPNAGNLRGLAGIDRSALGIPGEEEYVETYCQRRGIDRIDHWEFYLAFCFFRLAAIVQGVMKRGLDGNASSSRALEMGKLVAPLADMAVKIIASESTD